MHVTEVLAELIQLGHNTKKKKKQNEKEKTELDKTNANFCRSRQPKTIYLKLFLKYDDFFWGFWKSS